MYATLLTSHCWDDPSFIVPCKEGLATCPFFSFKFLSGLKVTRAGIVFLLVSYNIRVLVEGFMSDVVQIYPLLLDCIL
jgi:hypothetical protein